MGAIKALAAAVLLLLLALVGSSGGVEAEEYRRHTNNWAVIVRAHYLSSYRL
jgi:glycosylphosphatidylinositol transamidase (GPIT) subunit GPI8